MPFGRLHEEAAGESKLLVLSDAAWRMWGMGLIYCQKNLTDGFIDGQAISSWGIKAPNKLKVAQELCREQVKGRAPLWSRADGGYQVHDYLQWNDSKAQIMAAREIGKTRRQLYSDQELLATVRERDGSWCRYCGRAVNWKDRRGPAGATYDHIDPVGGNSIENLVIACRGCNSSKGPRPLDACTMRLLPPRTQLESSSESSSVLENAHAPASGTWNVERGSEEKKNGSGVFAGALPRTHLSHYACDETYSRCVPLAVHEKLSNLLAPKHHGDRREAGDALRAWYPTVWASLPADFVMPDAFKFWQARFDASLASTDETPKAGAVASTVPNAARTSAYLKQQREG